jgi:hypothetical protein
MASLNARQYAITIMTRFLKMPIMISVADPDWLVLFQPLDLDPGEDFSGSRICISESSKKQSWEKILSFCLLAQIGSEMETQDGTNQEP